MKSSTFISWLLLFSGTLTYVIGFWRACPLLSGKGYFLGVFITVWFVAWVYLREVMRGEIDERFISVCKLMALVMTGLLLVGVINAPLTPGERVLYPVALCVSLLGLVRVIRTEDRCNKRE
ncbi:inner membrane protein YiaB [Citrobacter rodentium]|jgi:Predicted membrane protein|uniref:Membrane protein n=2 Tax=Citrobacter rodentium TaxID=67825 RepID=D2TJU2_CITRI|nr:inner membrane protein YiaB [Citrobacter rodentium]KIQ51654.1 Inner membrane protein YiaB [Citrobacter rodentium]QBY30526.1 hypothetical protein E2R62_17955 [Citrobacter rodentium]UHO32103.1 hypothetical protein K7R23_05220 [Citrobacter rodentium NBRC 105723 = DSM 16636]CBG90940.1 putative membrane protein [Citrobacter rodentium ICC168]HAT8013073.1 hypothetical protein [Citrobacter rodentium NBRC 105723 = DSM 16636]